MSGSPIDTHTLPELAMWPLTPNYDDQGNRKSPPTILDPWQSCEFLGMWTELVTHVLGWEELWTSFLSFLNGSCANSLMKRVPTALLRNPTPEFSLTHNLLVRIYQNCFENPNSLSYLYLKRHFRCKAQGHYTACCHRRETVERRQEGGRSPIIID